MNAVRLTLLVAVLAACGLAAVWWRSRTVGLGYEAARVKRCLARVEEDLRVEQSRLAALASPASVAVRLRNMDLRLCSPGAALAARGAGTGGRAAAGGALALRGGRAPGTP